MNMMEINLKYFRPLHEIFTIILTNNIKILRIISEKYFLHFKFN
jgi:hypothetical protein